MAMVSAHVAPGAKAGSEKGVGWMRGPMGRDQHAGARVYFQLFTPGDSEAPPGRARV